VDRLGGKGRKIWTTLDALETSRKLTHGHINKDKGLLMTKKELNN